MSTHSNITPGGRAMPGGDMPPSFRVSGRDFSLSARQISVSGTVVSLAEVPYTQEHLDLLAEIRGMRERDWPYWLEDWPSTYALAEALAGEDSAALGRPILDLGCGSGFLAAFLRKRWGIPIFSCDFNADACRLAALNSALAGPSADPGGSEYSSASLSTPIASNAGSRVFCADFNRFPSSRTFGLILGGEMLYAKENQGPILDFLDRHLAPGGSAWLADPGRSAAAGFDAAAVNEGYRVLRRAIASRAAGRNVDVYKLFRPAAGH